MAALSLDIGYSRSTFGMTGGGTQVTVTRFGHRQGSRANEPGGGGRRESYTEGQAQPTCSMEPLLAACLPQACQAQGRKSRCKEYTAELSDAVACNRQGCLAYLEHTPLSHFLCRCVPSCCCCCPSPQCYQPLPQRQCKQRLKRTCRQGEVRQGNGITSLPVYPTRPVRFRFRFGSQVMP